MGELVNARTAAERLGVDVRTLYAYVSRGALRREPGPDGRSSRYDSDELDLLARRSRPRTLPRPAASIDLVIATRVSTVTDGMVRYRGTDVLDLVKAEAPFERVADLLWQAGPPETDGGWKPPGAGEPLAIPLSDEIPVLLLTARRERVDIDRGFSSGADDYLVKPFKPLDLAERVQRMISARQRSSQIPHAR